MTLTLLGRYEVYGYCGECGRALTTKYEDSIQMCKECYDRFESYRDWGEED